MQIICALTWRSTAAVSTLAQKYHSTQAERDYSHQEQAFMNLLIVYFAPDS